MKKLKLRKWVKVVLTIILLFIGNAIYNHTGVSGELAWTSNIYRTICVLEWFYICFIQVILFGLIWELD